MAPRNALFDVGAMADPDETSKAIRAQFDAMYPEMTDEDLVCRPSEAAHFCQVVRHRLKDESLEDYPILRMLQALRKRGGHAFGKTRRTMRLEAELAALRPGLERDHFCDTLADLFNGMFRDKTDEDMLCRPRESLKFCRAVRKHFDLPEMTDFLILHTVISLRKQGDLKSGQEAVA